MQSNNSILWRIDGCSKRKENVKIFVEEVMEG